MGRPLGLKLGLLGIEPAGDPTLLLRHDFSTGTLPTGTTFTRTGLALYWDAASEELRWSPHNYILQSESFDNASWTKTRVTVTADAIGNADKIVEDVSGSMSHYVHQSHTTTPGPWTSYVEAKAGERSWIALSLVDSGSVERFAFFNVGSGVVGTTGTGVTASIVDLGGGWYGCKATIAVAKDGSQQIRCFLASADNTAIYVGDGVSGVYLTSFRLVRGTVVSDIETTTASILDHKPRFGVTRPGETRVGYVCEPARTQRFVQSIWPSGFTSWTQTGVPTRVASDYGSDDGASAATFAASASQVYLTQAFTTVNNTTYAMSVEVEAVSGTITNAQLLTATSLPAGCTILGYRLNGNVLSVGGGEQVVVGRLDMVLGGAYTGAATDFHVGAGVTGAVTATVTLSRPQLESVSTTATLATATSSSFISTTTAAVARNADTATVSGASFTAIWNQTEGTAILDVALIGGGSYANAGGSLPFAISDGTNSERFYVGLTTTGAGWLFVGTDGGVSIYNITPAGSQTPAQQRCKVGFAVKENDCNGSVNGTNGTSDPLGAMPTTTQMTIGHHNSGSHGICIFYGLETYNVRKVNADLATLTTV